MNVFRIAFALIIMFLTSAVCMADSVVITFEGGKTQSITLDGSIKSITAVQYLPSKDQTRFAPASAAPLVNPATLPTYESKPPQQLVPEKPKVKFKWAEPVTGH